MVGELGKASRAEGSPSGADRSKVVVDSGRNSKSGGNILTRATVVAAIVVVATAVAIVVVAVVVVRIALAAGVVVLAVRAVGVERSAKKPLL